MGGSLLTAAQAAEAPDEGLLEFLGSVDSEDKDWHEYLARTDIDKVARRAGSASNPDGVAAPARPKPADPAGGEPVPAAGGAPTTTGPPPVAGRPVTSP